MGYIDFPAGDKAPEVFNVVVEVPKGSSNKYEYDHKLGVFRLERTLGPALHYPAEYGFVPSTRAADGFPVDAIVLGENGTFPGCLIEARAIGMLVMVDHGMEDLKLLCVPAGDRRFDHVTNHRDFSQHGLDEIKQFFRAYREIHGKKTLTQGWHGAIQAKEILMSAIEEFKRANAPS